MNVRLRTTLAMMALTVGFAGFAGIASAQPSTTTATAVAPTSTPAPTASADSRQAAIAAMLKPVDGVTYGPNSIIGVALSTQNADQLLQQEAGSLGSTYVYVTMLHYADFPGLHAAVSINDAHPTVHIKIGSSPNGRAFLVKVESNSKNANRSVKLGKSHFASFTAATTPDTDWVIPASITMTGPGMWALTPNADLAPGDYGVYVINSDGGGSAGDLYGFSVAK